MGSMAINHTPNEMLNGNGNSVVVADNDLNFPTAQRPGKNFERLRATLALKGYALYRTNPVDGLVTYWIEFSGVIRHSHTLHYSVYSYPHEGCDFE